MQVSIGLLLAGVIVTDLPSGECCKTEVTIAQGGDIVNTLGESCSRELVVKGALMYGPLLVGDRLWEEVGLTDKIARRWGAGW
jgi:hypothetical protein